MARRSVLTPEVQKIICDVIMATGTDKDAYTMAGVSPNAFYTWLKLGAAEPKGRHRDFLEAVEKARAARRVELVNRIRIAGRDAKHWTANAWLLERTEPKLYGNKLRVYVQEELSDAIARLKARLPPDEYERALDAITSGDGGEGAGADSVHAALPAGDVVAAEADGGEPAA